MLVKWITCTVTDRGAFDRGQRGWAAADDLAGLTGHLIDVEPSWTVRNHEGTAGVLSP